MLVVPPPLVPLLLLFDGQKTEADLREALVRGTGDLRVGELMAELVRTLSENGFLEDAAFERMRAERLASFAAAERRTPAHAGSAYPDETAALSERLAGYMDGVAPAGGAEGVVGIAAPHVSFEGGLRCYREAYAALSPPDAGRTCVVLGTSHYGEPGRFGLTRKPYVTPLGEAAVDLELADFLTERAGRALRQEDYCHAVEHSIEFQVVFLQHLLGRDLRILPVLCGPLGRADGGGPPEDEPDVAHFLEALGEMAAQHDGRLLWVLGVDMAHVGRRYGDAFDAHANRGRLLEVARQDRERIACLARGDAAAFWSEVRGPLDELKWCGASPFYVFLRAAGPLRGELRLYEQWNIDPVSVVSFAGMVFRHSARTA
jgi:AmmeMemoRadiSam system protein B